MEELKAVIALLRALSCDEQEGSHSLSAEELNRILTGKAIIKVSIDSSITFNVRSCKSSR